MAQPKEGDAPRILIVKLSAIGDVIAALSFASWIKALYPLSQIDWVVEERIAPLIAAHPDINSPIIADTKGWRARGLPLKEAKTFFKQLRSTHYDFVVDLQGNIKSGLITAMARSRVKWGLGFRSAAEWPSALALNHRIDIDQNLPIGEQFLSIFRVIFKRAPMSERPLVLKSKSEVRLDGARPYFMVCPGSNWINKQLPEEVLIEFLQLIDQDYEPTFVFIWGSESEQALVERLQTLFPQSLSFGRLDFGFWQRLIAHMDLMICVDSSSLHLCGTTTTPSFAFFGPSLGNVYNPRGDKRGFFQGSCPYGTRFVKRCPQLRSCVTGACLRTVRAETLFLAFNQWAFKAEIKRSKSTLC